MSLATSYPRPSFQRTHLNWELMGGPWDFIFDDFDASLSKFWYKKSILTRADGNKKQSINAPHAFQTPASGVGLHEAHEVIWYERTVSDLRSQGEIASDNCVLPRFEAVNYKRSVRADCQLIGGHIGGHMPFDADITDVFLSTSPAARLNIRVRDSPYDLTQPRGKQYWKPAPESIYYTPTSGIWLSVWLESVPHMRLASSSEGTTLLSNDIECGQLYAVIGILSRQACAKCSVEVEASLGDTLAGKSLKEVPVDKNRVSIDLDMKLHRAVGDTISALLFHIVNRHRQI